MAFDPLQAPGHLIRRAQQRHTAIWAELVPAELTSVQFAILAALDATPDIDQSTLGARTSFDSSTLGEVCGRLIERGLIERHRDPRDGRRNLLALSDEGRAALARAVPAVEQVGERLLEDLDADERRTFVALLARVVGV
ncbi:MAG TPA: MarR family winged helix-turn-helix transcriptional regulator [Capillimicrobium sp.]|nr:MarR family winged helix-turn-helix transcriptional regulator [Capillimicrobium sp.]